MTFETSGALFSLPPDVYATPPLDDHATYVFDYDLIMPELLNDEQYSETFPLKNINEELIPNGIVPLLGLRGNVLTPGVTYDPAASAPELSIKTKKDGYAVSQGSQMSNKVVENWLLQFPELVRSHLYTPELKSLLDKALQPSNNPMLEINNIVLDIDSGVMTNKVLKTAIELINAHPLTKRKLTERFQGKVNIKSMKFENRPGSDDLEFADFPELEVVDYTGIPNPDLSMALALGLTSVLNPQDRLRDALQGQLTRYTTDKGLPARVIEKRGTGIEIIAGENDNPLLSSVRLNIKTRAK